VLKNIVGLVLSGFELEVENLEKALDSLLTLFGANFHQLVFFHLFRFFLYLLFNFQLSASDFLGLSLF
jgi:hypothetical protein